MKIKFKILAFLSLTLIFSACGGERSSQAGAAKEQAGPAGEMAVSGKSEEDLRSLLRSLDELAALERAGAWFQGLALTESTIRENSGDYAGAVAAAYKELSWAYGKGLIPKEELEQGLLNLLAEKPNEPVRAAANAVLAFNRGQWAQAAVALQSLFNELEEPDGFGRWMILVCALEKNGEDKSAFRQAEAAYKAIRARYVQFPEYWYRGSRAFSGAVAAEYAENCINISPQGPFAGECRKLLASFTGLASEDGLSIKTKREIEEIIANSFNARNPQILDSLLPLIGLPDNPYTIFAVGALRALTPVQIYRDYFNVKAASSKGRLAERLTYISRG